MRKAKKLKLEIAPQLQFSAREEEIANLQNPLKKF